MNRTRFLLLFASTLLSLAGCKWLDEMVTKIQGPKSGEPLPPMQADQFVNYLNERAARFETLRADVRVTARGGGIPLPVNLDGFLAASQSRSFRMKVKGRVAGQVDLGSNSDQFWVFFDGAGSNPMYVYASHSDYETGKAKLPGGLPFEPEWVMQALGMTTFPPSNQYTALPPDQKNRTYTLSWPATLPNGTSVVKEIVFNGDPATGTKPQVKKHIIRDTKGKVICYAEIKQAMTVELTQTDPVSGQKTRQIDPNSKLPLAIQYPTLVVLRWEEEKFEMELELKAGQVNRPFTADESRDLFSRPSNTGVTPIDLAQYNAPVR